MATRRECREALAALFSTSTFTGGVYEYLPTNLSGATKALVVYNDESSHEVLSKLNAHNFYTFNVDTLVRRDIGNPEDVLDDLHEAVRNAIRAAIPSATWQELIIEDKSECFFSEISGLHYRVEQHKVQAIAKD